MSEDLRTLDRWPGYFEQSWQQRFMALDAQHSKLGVQLQALVSSLNAPPAPPYDADDADMDLAAIAARSVADPSMRSKNGWAFEGALAAIKLMRSRDGGDDDGLHLALAKLEPDARVSELTEAEIGALAASAVAQLARAARPFVLSIRPEVPDDWLIDSIAWTAGDFRRLAAALDAIPTPAG